MRRTKRARWNASVVRDREGDETMRIMTVNTNGIRSAYRKGFLDMVRDERPDVICIQELKCDLDKLPDLPPGYEGEFHPAQKSGYSGVAILWPSGQRPDRVEVGLGEERFDSEGRYLRADWGALSVISVYVPSASAKTEERLPYKMDFLAEFDRAVDSLREGGREIVMCGDFNIAHRPIDLKNDKANQTKSGFLPEERAWIDRLLERGYVDSHRQKVGPDEVIYTWWHLRSGSRKRNTGWRLDYHFTTPGMHERLQEIRVVDEPWLSDHAPVLGDYDI